MSEVKSIFGEFENPNAKNEEKVIMKRGLKADNFFSILPPSKHLPNFWRELINK